MQCKEDGQLLRVAECLIVQCKEDGQLLRMAEGSDNAVQGRWPAATHG